jgi:hypothetical protein
MRCRSHRRIGIGHGLLLLIKSCSQQQTRALLRRQQPSRTPRADSSDPKLRQPVHADREARIASPSCGPTCYVAAWDYATSGTIVSSPALALPLDITWRRLAFSRDMVDTNFGDLVLPPKWRSSMAVYQYGVPEEQTAES